MNIFVVDEDPVLAAQQLCDKHVVKMPTETAQLLSTVSWRYGVAAPYRPTHPHHPCTEWTAQSRQNAEWLLQHGLELCREYTRRYGRRHAARNALEKLTNVPLLLPASGQTPFVLCMPDKYKVADPVQSYHNFYVGDKVSFARWKHGSPDWWPYIMADDLEADYLRSE